MHYNSTVKFSKNLYCYERCHTWLLYTRASLYSCQPVHSNTCYIRHPPATVTGADTTNHSPHSHHTEARYLAGLKVKPKYYLKKTNVYMNT